MINRKRKTRLSAAIAQVLSEGDYLSNVAFNLKQSDKIEEGNRKILGELQVRWDNAARVLRQEIAEGKLLK